MVEGDKLFIESSLVGLVVFNIHRREIQFRELPQIVPAVEKITSRTVKIDGDRISFVRFGNYSHSLDFHSRDCSKRKFNPPEWVSGFGPKQRSHKSYADEQ